MCTDEKKEKPVINAARLKAKVKQSQTNYGTI